MIVNKNDRKRVRLQPVESYSHCRLHKTNTSMKQEWSQGPHELMIKLGRNEIREVIQLTGLADAFNKAVWVEAGDKVEISEVKLNEFWKAHNLPMTTEDYKNRLRYNFQLAKHPALIRRYSKGEFAVVSFDSIVGSGDFIGATERLMVIEFLEDVEFEKDLLITCRSGEGYQEALQPYLQNDLIKLHNVSGTMLFKPLTTLED